MNDELAPTSSFIVHRSIAIAVILLGTGYPRPDANHAGPSTAIVARRQMVRRRRRPRHAGRDTMKDER